MNFTVLFAIPIWVAVLGTGAVDYLVTVKGLEQRLAEEGNPIVRWLYGGKPNKLQLLAALLPQDLLPLVALTISLLFINPGVSIGVGAAMTVRHLRNIYLWEKLGVNLD